VPKGLVEGSEQMSLQGHLVVGHGRSLHAFQLTAAFRGAHNSRQRACGRLAAEWGASMGTEGQPSAPVPPLVWACARRGGRPG
jgi:hypothetical protein